MQNLFLAVTKKTIQGIAFLYLLASIAFGIRLTFAHFDMSMDFGSFMASGIQANAGENPYNSNQSLVFVVPITDYKLLIPSPNLNPPLSVLPFQILAAITKDPLKDVVTWKILSLSGYILVIYYLIRTYALNNKWITILWFFSLAGFWQTVEVGQIYIPLLMLAFLAWRELEKQNFIASGICLGILIAVKPQFIIWAIFLLLADKKSVFIISGITAFVLSILPILLYGFNIYIEWITAASQYTGIILPGNTSIQSLSARLEFPGNNWVMPLTFLAFTTIYIINTKPPLMQTSAIGILTTLLVSPYSWTGYTLFLLPVFLRKKKWSWKARLSAGMLAFPLAFVLVYYTKGIISFLLIGWIYGWAILVLFWDETHGKNDQEKIST